MPAATGPGRGLRHRPLPVRLDDPAVLDVQGGRRRARRTGDRHGSRRPATGPRRCTCRASTGPGTPARPGAPRLRAGRQRAVRRSGPWRATRTTPRSSATGTAPAGGVSYAPGAVGRAMVLDGRRAREMTAPNTVRTDASFSVSRLGEAGPGRRRLARRSAGRATPGRRSPCSTTASGERWVFVLPGSDTAERRSGTSPVAASRPVAEHVDAPGRHLRRRPGRSACMSTASWSARRPGAARRGTAPGRADRQDWTGGRRGRDVRPGVLGTRRQGRGQPGQRPGRTLAARRRGRHHRARTRPRAATTACCRAAPRSPTTARSTGRGARWTATVTTWPPAGPPCAPTRASRSPRGLAGRAASPAMQAMTARQPGRRPQQRFRPAVQQRASASGCSSGSRGQRRRSGRRLDRAVGEPGRPRPVRGRTWPACSTRPTRRCGSTSTASSAATTNADGAVERDAVRWPSGGQVRRRVGDHWPGWIDEVRTYSRALSAAELEGIVSRRRRPGRQLGARRQRGPTAAATARDGTLFGGPTWTAGQSTGRPGGPGGEPRRRTTTTCGAPLSVNDHAELSRCRRGSGSAAQAGLAGGGEPGTAPGRSRSSWGHGTDGSGGPANRWAFQVNGRTSDDHPACGSTPATGADRRVDPPGGGLPGGLATGAALRQRGRGRDARLGTHRRSTRRAGSRSGAASGTARTSNYFPGAIDDVKVYSRPLFAEEIRVMAGRDLALVHNWRLDEGSGATAADAVGGRPATLTGGAGYGPGRVRQRDPLRRHRRRRPSTTGVDLRTDQSFTVSAWVNLDGRSRAAGPAVRPRSASTGVARASRASSGSATGIDNDQAPGSASGSSRCRSRDGAGHRGRDLGRSRSEFGTWVHLVGVYDPPASKIWLYVTGHRR